MHKEILSNEQLKLLPFIKQFYREYYLVGGTAIALHIGHRRSIDFDLFKKSQIRRKSISSRILNSQFSYNITRSVTEQLNVTINDVKFTFFEYPYDIKQECIFDDIIKLPNLLTLAAMKPFALGRRSKWKDYVDLYFILKDYYSLKEIPKKAELIFNDFFSKVIQGSNKLFRRY